MEEEEEEKEREEGRERREEAMFNKQEKETWHPPFLSPIASYP